MYMLITYFIPALNLICFYIPWEVFVFMYLLDEVEYCGTLFEYIHRSCLYIHHGRAYYTMGYIQFPVYALVWNLIHILGPLYDPVKNNICSWG